MEGAGERGRAAIDLSAIYLMSPDSRRIFVRVTNEFEGHRMRQARAGVERGTRGAAPWHCSLLALGACSSPRSQ